MPQKCRAVPHAAHDTLPGGRRQQHRANSGRQGLLVYSARLVRKSRAPDSSLASTLNASLQVVWLQLAHSVLRPVAFAPAPSHQRKENAGKRELSFALSVVFVSCSSLERVLREGPVDISLTQDARPERAMLVVASRVRSVSPQAETRPSTAGAGPAVQSG
jgi:hypothetical protein